MLSSKSIRDVWRQLERLIAPRSNDIHFLSVHAIDPRKGRKRGASVKLALEASVGLNATEARRLADMEPEDPHGELNAVLHQALATGDTMILSTSDGTINDGLLDHFRRCGVVVPCRDLVIMPVKCGLETCDAAVVVVGVAPLRKPDADYRLFMELLRGQLEGAMTIVSNLQHERELYTAHLALESETPFVRFAERAPVGIYMYDHVGTMTFCNKAFEDIVGQTRDQLRPPMAWVETIHSESRDEILAIWDRITINGEPRSFDIMFNKPWLPKGEGHMERLDRTYALGMSYPDVAANGEVKGVLGCLTDISHVRWAEKIQAEKLAEALELKRQQEQFLDLTSHEMRNPLNAIFHCAAELAEHLTAELGNTAPHAFSDDLVRECVTMAETITYCAHHQKRIVDDVLTLSKMDSRLLQMYPISTDPSKFMQTIIAIFDSELRASDIKAEIVLRPSYTERKPGMVLIDAHRITQIIINLVSNSLKFMKGRSDRRLQLVLNASDDEPPEMDGGVQFVHSGAHKEDPTGRPEWGDGQALFLSFSIEDTGGGMSKDEVSLLFNRFQQASPRTHTQYGGTGLGLFISRELAEMHGGRIGVASKPGEGSIFGFYVKARRDLSAPTTKTKKASPVAAPQTPARSASNASKKGVGVDTKGSERTRVLIVEDNVVNQRILEKVLKKRGYHTLTANHGEEALEIIAKSTWNLDPSRTSSNSSTERHDLRLILCDVEMPIMDGKTFVKRVRDLQREGRLASNGGDGGDGTPPTLGATRGRIPVIAVTGNARGEQVRAALECGFDALVTKPYQVGELMGVVEEILKGEDVPMDGCNDRT